jgi:6,7-dimethyl-8-ribityllumazine synthase
MLVAEKGKFEVFDANGWKIAIVVAQFNKTITDCLLDSALLRAKDYQILDDSIDIFKVVGAIEIPLVLKKLATTNKYAALLAIGCVINGDTPHFEYVCKFVTEGILSVQMETAIPVGFGILTCATEDQAEARMHLGKDHLDAVLLQAKLLKNISLL